MNKKHGYAPAIKGSAHRPEYPLPQGGDYFKVKTIKPAKPVKPVSEEKTPADALPRLHALPRNDAPSRRTSAAYAEHTEQRAKQASYPTHTSADVARRSDKAALPKAESRMAIKARDADVFAENMPPTSRMAMKLAMMTNEEPNGATDTFPAAGHDSSYRGVDSDYTPTPTAAKVTRSRAVYREDETAYVPAPKTVKAARARAAAYREDDTAYAPAPTTAKATRARAAYREDDTAYAPAPTAAKATRARAAAYREDETAYAPAPTAAKATRARAAAYRETETAYVPAPTTAKATHARAAAYREDTYVSGSEYKPIRSKRGVRLPLDDSELDTLNDDGLYLDTPPNKRNRNNKPMAQTGYSRTQSFPSVRPSKTEARSKRRIIIVAGLALIVTVAALFLLLKNNDEKIPAGAIGPMSTVYAEAHPPEPTDLAALGAAVIPTPSQTPSATPTVSPTATLEASATPEPTVSPSPTATTKPTSTPKATVKPTATPTTTVKPTATPTATVKPTATPAATAKPTPTVTVKPTATPTSAPTQAPTTAPTQEPTPTTDPTPTE